MSKKPRKGENKKHLLPSTRPTSVTTQTKPPASNQPRHVVAPPSLRKSRSWLFWAFLGLAVLGALAGFWVTRPDNKGGNREGWEPVTDQDEIVQRFVQWHNTGDPRARELLGRTPSVPEEPITPEEADRLQTDFFLRNPGKIVDVWRREHLGGGQWRPLPGNQYLLVVEGGFASPRIPVREDGHVHRGQRVLKNPDLIVEVRDGKLYGVRAQIHLDPPKPGARPSRVPRP